MAAGIPAYASAEYTADADLEFETIVVTATKSEREINEIAANKR